MSFKIQNDRRQEILKYFKGKSLVALDSCGFVAEGYAKDNVRKQVKNPTGALMNSITYKVKENDKGAECYIGTDIEYAVYVELGTGEYYEGGRKSSWTYKDAEGNWHMTKGQRAKPYLKPAITDHIDKYKKIIKQEFQS